MQRHQKEEEIVMVIKDPVWGIIECPRYIKAIITSQQFQRLNFISQMGFTHFVFPGATHTRFSHSIGVYYLALKVLEQLRKVDKGRTIPPEEEKYLLTAALLHDVGHYPFSHTLEELKKFREKHEDVSVKMIERYFSSILENHGIDPKKVIRILQKKGTSETEKIFTNILNSPIDIDKCDNLRRDAYFCGVNYGLIDVERLILSMRLNRERDGIAITEKGVAAVESLISGVYLMFRNIYWHHAVRAAHAMLKRAVLDEIEKCRIKVKEIIGMKDFELINKLKENPLVNELINRRLYKRARTIPEYILSENEGRDVLLSLDDDNKRKAAEEKLRRIVSKESGEDLTTYDIIIDVPDPKRTIEVEALERLEVYYKEPPKDLKNPVQFIRKEVSMLPDAVLRSFLENVRRIRIFTRSEKWIKYIRKYIDKNGLKSLLE